MKQQFHKEYMCVWLSYEHKFSMKTFSLVYFL